MNETISISELIMVGGISADEKDFNQKMVLIKINRIIENYESAKINNHIFALDKISELLKTLK